MNSKSSRRGFTIIELLVVIAILTMLLGILLPSLSASRRQAKANVCLSTLKGLATSFNVYLTENRDQFPPFRLRYWNPKDSIEDEDAKKFVNEHNCKEPRWQWFLQLDSGPVNDPLPFRRLNRPWGDKDLNGLGRKMTNPTFQCPALDDPEFVNDIRNGAFGYNYQYLGNARHDAEKGRWDNFSVGLHQVKAAGGTVLLADSRGGAKRHGPHSYTLDPPRRAYERNAKRFGPTVEDLQAEGYDPNPIYAFSPVEGRHNSQANVMFVDAHGEAMTAKELGYELRPEDQMPIPIHEAATGTQWNNSLWTGTGQDPEAEKRQTAPAP